MGGEEMIVCPVCKAAVEKRKVNQVLCGSRKCKNKWIDAVRKGCQHELENNKWEGFDAGIFNQVLNKLEVKV